MLTNLMQWHAIFSVLDEKEAISDQQHLFQAQIEALSSNHSLLRSNLTHLHQNVQSLTDSVRFLVLFPLHNQMIRRFRLKTSSQKQPLGEIFCPTSGKDDKKILKSQLCRIFLRNCLIKTLSYYVFSGLSPFWPQQPL